MFDRLAACLMPLWVLCIAGAVIVVGLVLKLEGWPLFAGAGLIGLAGIPLAVWTSRRIRKGDPNWPARRPAGGRVF